MNQYTQNIISSHGHYMRPHGLIMFWKIATSHWLHETTTNP